MERYFPEFRKKELYINIQNFRTGILLLGSQVKTALTRYIALHLAEWFYNLYKFYFTLLYIDFDFTSRVFGWIVRNSEIRHFDIFWHFWPCNLRIFWKEGNFCNISPRFEIIGRMESASCNWWQVQGNWNQLPASETWKRLQATGCKGWKISNWLQARENNWLVKCVGEHVNCCSREKSCYFWLLRENLQPAANTGKILGSKINK